LVTLEEGNFSGRTCETKPNFTQLFKEQTRSQQNQTEYEVNNVLKYSVTQLFIILTELGIVLLWRQFWLNELAYTSSVYFTALVKYTELVYATGKGESEKCAGLKVPSQCRQCVW
jgi:hypothetical protein